MDSRTVLIVEDEALVAKDIALYLKDAGYTVIGVAHDSETAMDFLHSRKPDFAILDINIIGSKDGIDIARIINEKYQIPFIFVTAFSDLHTLNRAKEVKPFAYIVKPFDEKDILSSVTIALHNFDQMRHDNILPLVHINQLIPQKLSNKEFEIIEDLLQGFTNNQIAEKQFVSSNTVKFHLKNIFLKLDVSNRSSAIKQIMELRNNLSNYT